MVKICRTTVLRGPAVRRSGCLQVPAAHDLNVERARVRVRSHLSRAVADERTMPPRPNNKKGAEHAVDPGAALTVLGASDELRQREERLEQLEREIAVKEACLASGDAAAATGDPVLGARWQCLAQARRQSVLQPVLGVPAHHCCEAVRGSCAPLACRRRPRWRTGGRAWPRKRPHRQTRSAWCCRVGAHLCSHSRAAVHRRCAAHQRPCHLLASPAQRPLRAVRPCSSTPAGRASLCLGGRATRRRCSTRTAPCGPCSRSSGSAWGSSSSRPTAPLPRAASSADLPCARAVVTPDSLHLSCAIHHVATRTFMRPAAAGPRGPRARAGAAWAGW